MGYKNKRGGCWLAAAEDRQTISREGAVQISFLTRDPRHFNMEGKVLIIHIT